MPWGINTEQTSLEDAATPGDDDLVLGGCSHIGFSMKVLSRVPQGDRQTVLHSGDTAQNVPVDMGVGRLSAQFLWYHTISTTAFQVEKLLQTGQVTADRCV